MDKLAQNLDPQDKVVLETMLFEGSVVCGNANVDDSVQDPYFDGFLLASLQNQEAQAIMLSERGEQRKARQILDTILLTHPNYASAYNNRAQLRRCEAEPLKVVVEDLSRAIGLATGPVDAPISRFQARVLCSAHSQLAAVYIEELKVAQGEERWALQELVSQNLAQAGRYGDSEAAHVAASYNPYSRLCGAIVEELLSYEKGLS